MNATTTNTDDTELSPTFTVGAAGAARMFSVSVRTWWRWNSSGKCPRPSRIGRCVLWRIEDLRRWASMGLPDRAEFEARRMGDEAEAVA